MAVPFRRTSKTKKRMRRTHLKKTAANVVTCPNCGQKLRLPRRKGKIIATSKRCHNEFRLRT